MRLILSSKMIKSYLNKFKKTLLDGLFPIECLSCNRDGRWICKKCLRKIYIRTIDNCPACKKESIYGKTHEWCIRKTQLDGMIVAVSFKDRILQDAVHKLKYSYIKDLSTPLSEILARKIIELDTKDDLPNLVSLLISENPIIIPVPLHKKRLRKRDFNQAELLSRKISTKFNLEHQSGILKRVKYTKPQTELKKNERKINVSGVFEVDIEWKSKLKNTKIILVDDVATTGSTLNDSARALKECGALEVWGLVLARG